MWVIQRASGLQNIATSLLASQLIVTNQPPKSRVIVID